VNTLLFVNLTPFTMVQITFIINRSLLEWGTGNVSLDMINTNFINLQYPSPQTIGGHLLQGVRAYEILLLLNYNIITGHPSLLMSVPVHIVVVRLCNSPNLRFCS